MSDPRFYLKGQEVVPENWKAVEMQVAFDNDNPSASLATKQFVFTGSYADLIHQHNAASPGIFEGPLFEIKTCLNQSVFKGCLDTAASEALYACDRIEIPIRDQETRDYLTDRGDSFRFAYLASGASDVPQQAAITFADYKPVPYVISAIPDYTQAMILGLGIFSVVRETIEIIRTIGELIAEAANPVTLPSALVKIGLYLVYLTTLIVSVITMVQSLVDNIIQPKKHKLGMHVRDLFLRGCSYLGINFSSTIFAPNSVFYRAAIIPKKILDPEPSNLNVLRREKDELQTPNESYGYPDMTFGEFLRTMENVFNARARLYNNTLFFERVDTFNIGSPFVLPDIKLEPYRYNADELASNYLYSWDLDDADMNTYDEFIGTNAQMQARLTMQVDPKNNLLRNLTEVRPGLALAKRKKVLTAIEKGLNTIINGLATVANAITGGINAILQLVGGSFQIPQLPTNILNNRIGWLKLSSDYIGVPKFCILDAGNEIHPNNETLTSAEFMMNTFHFVNWPLSNQWKIFENFEIPFCCDDFANTKSKSYLTTFDGKAGKFSDIRWQMGASKATVTFRIKETYTTNITQTLIVNKN